MKQKKFSQEIRNCEIDPNELSVVINRFLDSIQEDGNGFRNIFWERVHKIQHGEFEKDVAKEIMEKTNDERSPSPDTFWYKISENLITVLLCYFENQPSEYVGQIDKILGLFNSSDFVDDEQKYEQVGSILDSDEAFRAWAEHKKNTDFDIFITAGKSSNAKFHYMVNFQDMLFGYDNGKYRNRYVLKSVILDVMMRLTSAPKYYTMHNEYGDEDSVVTVRFDDDKKYLALLTRKQDVESWCKTERCDIQHVELCSLEEISRDVYLQDYDGAALYRASDGRYEGVKLLDLSKINCYIPCRSDGDLFDACLLQRNNETFLPYLTRKEDVEPFKLRYGFNDDECNECLEQTLLYVCDKAKDAFNGVAPYSAAQNQCHMIYAK